MKMNERVRKCLEESKSGVKESRRGRDRGGKACGLGFGVSPSPRKAAFQMVLSKNTSGRVGGRET